MTALRLEHASLKEVLDILKSRGYTIVGPKVRASAMVLDTLESLDELPLGWQDRQAPGDYTVSKLTGVGFFQHSCGPHSWKRYLYPPHMQLFKMVLDDRGIRPEHTQRPTVAYAFLGMRACDLKALSILDRVLAEQTWPDPYYQAIRNSLFIIAVNCLKAGGTCFCAAMGAGPRADTGYDIVLSEICEPDRHGLIAEPGSRRGAELLSVVNCHPASPSEVAYIRRLSDETAATMRGMINLSNAASLFGAHFEHPHWLMLEQRCLACGNCTLVCPTCFCHAVSEAESLDGHEAERLRIWDSCFSRTFSYIHGGSIRRAVASRYRQWLCHKLSTWQEQFGIPGCVGCGRCRTWCPAGIDLIEEFGLLTGAVMSRG